MEFDDHEEQEEEVRIHVMNSTGIRKTGGSGYRYKECLKNHAINIGGHALDGCGEFMPAGDDGTLDGLKCAACNCHRNFHRKEVLTQQPLHPHHRYNINPPPYYQHHNCPAGYLHITPPPLALPSTEDLEEISNPSSSGGGGGGGTGGGGNGGLKSKRFRTKFTVEQKDKMLAFSEALGWRIQKHDEGAVQQFCEETGVKRNVLKVWMHNNKHTVGNKP
ncbi:zinc-finger homeodomain protein 1-like [Bidens hawaiensis]|uniref:zinc-finger homeodomain protein 1-like n=1 Tax=Bidens hawaiensis TaxID=980011 RepID=UPI00404B3BFE